MSDLIGLSEKASIYTRAELEHLVKANRIAPLARADLCKLHEIRRTLGARIDFGKFASFL